VNNQVVYAQELLYQVVVGLPENRAEDVWSPDVLSRYVNKVQQYHHLFFEAPEIFFRNTQIWGNVCVLYRAFMLTHFYGDRKIGYPM
jgi:hypothetical protein